jgi:hypothetical protein
VVYPIQFGRLAGFGGPIRGHRRLSRSAFQRSSLSREKLLTVPGEERPIFEGQRLPEVLALLVVLGNQYPASRTAAETPQEVLWGPLEARQGKDPFLVIIARGGNRGRGDSVLALGQEDALGLYQPRVHRRQCQD